MLDYATLLTKEQVERTHAASLRAARYGWLASSQ